MVTFKESEDLLLNEGFKCTSLDIRISRYETKSKIAFIVHMGMRRGFETIIYIKNEADKLKKDLIKIEKQLDKCRTTVLIDGWQTQRHSKKARKWDFHSEQKRVIMTRLFELEVDELLNTKTQEELIKISKRNQII